MTEAGAREHRERLTGWLRTVVSLVDGQQLDSVLRRTVEAACAVTGARAGALEPATLEAPLLSGSVDGPALAGEDQPAVLRVPVTVDGSPFATICLTGPRDGGAFSADDEHLVAALAAVAGATVGRLTLQREHRRERWVAWLNDISSALLAGSHSDDVLNLAAEGARELAEADLVAVCLADPATGLLEVRAAHGAGADSLAGSWLAGSGPAVTGILLGGEAVVVDDGGDGAHSIEPLALAGVTGPALVVPLLMDGRRVGVVAVGRVAGRLAFSDDDCWLVESFASQVSVALEYGVAHVELKRVAVAADQERIARDLHDTVIQQLFAIGMSLQTLSRSVREPDQAIRLRQAVDGLDATIADIRDTVFALQNPAQECEGLRAEVRQMADEISETYGLSCQVRFHGLLDIAVPEPVATSVLATVREALSNVGRHAMATEVEVDIEVAAAVMVRVADDGIGLPEHPERRSGLRNLEVRAESLGGSMRLSRSGRGGTVVLWRVPLTNGLDRGLGAQVAASAVRSGGVAAHGAQDTGAPGRSRLAG